MYNQNFNEVQNVPCFWQFFDYQNFSNNLDTYKEYVKSLFLNYFNDITNQNGIIKGADNPNFQTLVFTISLEQYIIYEPTGTLNNLFNINYFFVIDNDNNYHGYFVQSVKNNANTVTFTCIIDAWIEISQNLFNNKQLFILRRNDNLMACKIKDIDYQVIKNDDGSWDYKSAWNFRPNSIIRNHDNFCNNYTNLLDRNIGVAKPDWIKFRDSSKYDEDVVRAYKLSNYNIFTYAIFTKDPGISKLPLFAYGPDDLNNASFRGHLRMPLVDGNFIQQTPYLIVPYANYVSHLGEHLFYYLQTFDFIENPTLNTIVYSPFPLTSFNGDASHISNFNLGALVFKPADSDFYATFINGNGVVMDIVNENATENIEPYTNIQLPFNELLSNVFKSTDEKTLTILLNNLINIDYNFSQYHDPHIITTPHAELDFYRTRKQIYNVFYDYFLYDYDLTDKYDNFVLKAQCSFSPYNISLLLKLNMGLYKQTTTNNNHGLLIMGNYQIPSLTNAWLQFNNTSKSTFDAVQLNNFLNMPRNLIGDLFNPAKFGADIFGGGTTSQRMQQAQVQDLKRRPDTLNNGSLNDYTLDATANDYNFTTEVNERYLKESDRISVQSYTHYNGYPCNRYEDFNVNTLQTNYLFNFYQIENIDLCFREYNIFIQQQLHLLFKTGVRLNYYRENTKEVMTNQYNPELCMINNITSYIDETTLTFTTSNNDLEYLLTSNTGDPTGITITTSNDFDFTISSGTINNITFTTTNNDLEYNILT